jgi:hypothetical protein
MDEDKARMEYEEDDLGNSFQKTYGWYLVVNRITSNDFTKHEFVYQKKLMEVLNQLSFLIQYDQEQIRLQRKAQGQIV